MMARDEFPEPKTRLYMQIIQTLPNGKLITKSKRNKQKTETEKKNFITEIKARGFRKLHKIWHTLCFKSAVWPRDLVNSHSQSKPSTKKPTGRIRQVFHQS